MNVIFDHEKEKITDAVGVTDFAAAMEKPLSEMSDTERVAMAGIGLQSILKRDEFDGLCFFIEKERGILISEQFRDWLRNNSKITKILELMVKVYPELIEKLAFIGYLRAATYYTYNNEEV